MKYASVIVIWLWANLILIISAPLIFFIHHNIKEGTFISTTQLFTNTMLSIYGGFVFTIPSLVIMLVFHLSYSRGSSYLKDYFKPYCFLILCINVIYFVVFKFFSKSEFIPESNIELLIICLITTAAGLGGLYIEHKRLTKSSRKY